MHRFYALIARLKFINRWSLMRNTRNENVAEHSHNTAVLAHALATIERDVFLNEVDPNLCVTIATFHEAAEVITGDLPTPIKYYNDEIRTAYKDIEKQAEDKLVTYLPDILKNSIQECIQPNDGLERELVKCADKLAALIKCLEELSFGNREFATAYEATLKILQESKFKSVQYFLDNFLDAYSLNLDELL